MEELCQLSIPLIGGQVNEYRMGVGGIAKVVVPTHSQRELLEYLKGCVVRVVWRGMEGEVKLWKVLAHRGEVIGVEVRGK